MKTLIFIILLLAIILILYLPDTVKNKNKNINTNTNMNEHMNLNDIVIINRSNEQEKLLDKLINQKKILFTNDEINTLKEDTQFYDVSNDNNIINITKDIDNDFTKQNNANKNIINKNLNQINQNNIVDIIDLPFVASGAKPIINDCNDVITNDLTASNNLNYYYRDIFGDKIHATMDDYVTAYNTTIDETNPKYAIPVEIIKGKNWFILPNQYATEKYWTNAYNVDYSRIINPALIY